MAGQKSRIKVFEMGKGNEYGSVLRSDLSPSDLTSALAEANEFDLSYLPENSQGVLVQGQASLLLKNLIGPSLIILVTLGFLGFQLRAQGLIKQLSTGTSISHILSNIPQSSLIIGGILLAVVLYAIILLTTTLLDVFGGVVSTLEGPGWKKITTSTDDDGSTTTRTYYIVADQRFSVKSRGLGVLENGRNYRVYFTPRRKILVNIEALD